MHRDGTGEFAVINEQTGEKTHFRLKKKRSKGRKSSARIERRPATPST
jgi:hypothetical protein